MRISNYWCPACEKWIASSDMFTESQRHKECGTRCEWKHTESDMTIPEPPSETDK